MTQPEPERFTLLIVDVLNAVPKGGTDRIAGLARVMSDQPFGSLLDVMVALGINEPEHRPRRAVSSTPGCAPGRPEAFTG